MERIFYRIEQDTKKTLKIVSLSLLFLFIIGYAFFASKELIFGIKIKEVQLKPDSIKKQVINITGLAEKAVDLKLNGRAISIDQAGNFNETIVLLPGYNIVELKARDKFGSEDIKNYQLVN